MDFKKIFRIDKFFRTLGIASFAVGYTNYRHQEKLRTLREQLKLEELRRISLEDENRELLHK
jgi:hypothetical protein